MANEVTTTKKETKHDVVKAALQATPFERSLPNTIAPEKFRNTILTAINLNPDLLDVDQTSLLTACMKAAADGLLPDNREAALVPYNAKVKRGGQDVYIKAVQYLPMPQGVIKRLRNSGEISSISVRVVCRRDFFEYVLGDEERIIHRPAVEGDRGEILGAYAIAKFKDDSDPQREWMSKADIDKTRAASKSPDSPAWKNWYDEMARKAVLHRISKYLPMSAENASFLNRDDDEPVVSAPVDITPAAPSLAPPTPPADAPSKLEQFETAGTPTTRKRAKAAQSELPVEQPTGHDQDGVVLDGDYAEVENGEPQDAPTADAGSTESLLKHLAAGTSRTELSFYWKSEATQKLLAALSKEDMDIVRRVYADRYNALPKEAPQETV